MKEVIDELYRYSGWATQRILSAIEQLPHERYVAAGCSGHGSIRDTFAHLLETQRGWFNWFNGTMGPAEAIHVSIAPEEVDTPADAARVAADVDRQVSDCLATLDDEQLAKVWSWSLPSGQTGSLELWKMILHVANHSTHTRAQILAALGNAGQSPGNIDFIFYQWKGAPRGE
jgi:uncharacterized damage-inducible protein DinB